MNPGLPFEQLFERSFGLYCVASTDGYLKWLNRHWETVLGWSREELTSRPFIEFVHPDDVAPTFDEVQSMKADARSMSRCAAEHASST